MTPIEFDAARTAMLAQMTGVWKVRQEIPSWVKLESRLSKVVVSQMDQLRVEIGRLRNHDLQIAFVGSFNAGKSSLVNALLGRVILPEANKVTTAVPTHVRRVAAGDPGGERIVVHWLDDTQLDDLDRLFRAELSQEITKDNSLTDLPERELLKECDEAAARGTAKELIADYRRYLERRSEFAGSRQPETKSLAALASLVADETLATFLDRVEVFIESDLLPEDVKLVDLPGLGVTNPRHRRITREFVAERANAVVFVLNASAPFTDQEKSMIALLANGQSRAGRRLFFSLNRWDMLKDNERREVMQTFRVETERLDSLRDPYCTNARDALLIPLVELSSNDDKPASHLPGPLREKLQEMKARLGQSGTSAEELLSTTNVPRLRDDLAGFLADDLRREVLESAADVARKTVAQPLRPVLDSELQALKKQSDEGLTADVSRQSLEQFNDARQQAEDRLEASVRDIITRINQTGPAIFEKASEALLEQVRRAIDSGEETDCLSVRDNILGKKYRKECYFLEIEMQVVDKLNRLAKTEFIRAMDESVQTLIQQYIQQFQQITAELLATVEQAPDVQQRFLELEEFLRTTASNKVISLIEGQAGSLDQLLTYTNPNPGLGEQLGICRPQMRPMLRRLHEVAIASAIRNEKQKGRQDLSSVRQTNQTRDLHERTESIRELLRDEYLAACRQFEQEVREEAPVTLKNVVHDYDDKMKQVLQTEFAAAVKHMIDDQAAGRLSDRRSGLQKQLNILRGLIDRLDQHQDRMQAIELQETQSTQVAVSEDSSHDKQPGVAYGAASALRR